MSRVRGIMGIVIAAFFSSMCITGSTNIPKDATWQMLTLVIILIIPSVVGAVISILFFICGSNHKALPFLVYLSSILGIVRILLSIIQTIYYSNQFVSMNTTIGMLLKISIYGLIIYQTNVLCKKRTNTVTVDEQ